MLGLSSSTHPQGRNECAHGSCRSKTVNFAVVQRETFRTSGGDLSTRAQEHVSEWKLPFTGRGWDKNWKGLAVALFLGTFWNARFTFPDE